MKIPPLYCQRWTSAERPTYEVAETIMEKWRAAGHPNVKAWVEVTSWHAYDRSVGSSVPTRREIIRSNLVNGLPPA